MIQLFHAVRDGPRARAPNHNPQAETLLLIRPNGPMRTKFEEEQNTMTLKKLAALALALVLVLSVSVTALATGADTLSGGIYNHTAGTNVHTENNKVRILKELVIYNTDGRKIYLPEVSYTYSIELDSTMAANTYITDAQSPNVTAYVNNTDANAQALQTSSATVSFSSTTTYENIYTAAGAQEANTWVQPIAASATGTSIYGAFDIAFTPANFDHPGVYRYKITETPSGRAESGVVTGTDQPVGTSDATKDVRYLDVYVRGVYNDPTNPPATGEYDTYEIYGFVCFTNEQSIDATAAGSTAPAVTAAKKTNGFVHSGDNLTALVDQYKTYNIDVSKAITGNLAQTGHDFPFVIELNSSLKAKVAYGDTETTATIKTNANVTETGYASNKLELTAATAKTVNAGLSHQEHVNLNGIPSKAVVSLKVNEKNDTWDVYAPSVNIDSTAGNLYDTDATQTAEHIITALQRDAYAHILNISLAADNFADKVIAFTNNLSEISPTGYVARIAPYVLMLIGGVTLFIILAVKRRKNEEEEA